jgi:hypothetical protein
VVISLLLVFVHRICSFENLVKPPTQNTYLALQGTGQVGRIHTWDRLESLGKRQESPKLSDRFAGLFWADGILSASAGTSFRNRPQSVIT